MKVAYLQKAPSGHMNACLQQLIDDDVDVFATLPKVLADSPFEVLRPDGLAEEFPVDGWSPDDALVAAVRKFAPDVLLVVGWDKALYRHCAQALRGETVRVLCTDSQWLGTARQWVGVAIAPWYIKRRFDRMFVPGERQRIFAGRLGFETDMIDEGFCSADVAQFSVADVATRRAFVFVGRLVPEKGFDILLDAYDRYRSTVVDPFELLIAGTGPMGSQVANRTGVTACGFVLPHDLPAVFARGSALVLPSRFEPWGVVVHEATCAGLGVLASDRVGATDVLVSNRENGMVFAPTSDGTLASMLWWHGLSDSERRAAQRSSLRLSAEFSPVRWSETVRRMAEHRP